MWACKSEEMYFFSSMWENSDESLGRVEACPFGIRLKIKGLVLPKLITAVLMDSSWWKDSEGGNAATSCCFRCVPYTGSSQRAAKCKTHILATGLGLRFMVFGVKLDWCVLKTLGQYISNTVMFSPVVLLHLLAVGQILPLCETLEFVALLSAVCEHL